MEVEQYSFKHPTSFIVSGATQSGKSTFVKNLLANKNDLICPTPKVTYMIYKIWQPIYTEMLEMGLVTKFIQGIPEMKEIHTLLSSHKDDGGLIIIFESALCGRYETRFLMYHYVQSPWSLYMSCEM